MNISFEKGKDRRGVRFIHLFRWFWTTWTTKTTNFDLKTHKYCLNLGFQLKKWCQCCQWCQIK
jgi:hypothetical protein